VFDFDVADIAETKLDPGRLAVPTGGNVDRSAVKMVLLLEKNVSEVPFEVEHPFLE
jgi:hypothetical protein